MGMKVANFAKNDSVVLVVCNLLFIICDVTVVRDRFNLEIYQMALKYYSGSWFCTMVPCTILKGNWKKLTIQYLLKIRQSRVYVVANCQEVFSLSRGYQNCMGLGYHYLTRNKHQEKTMIRMYPQCDVTVDKNKQIIGMIEGLRA